MRVTWAIAVGGLALAGGCLRRTSHQCETTAQCGPSGTCELTGACSFPAIECKSGRRYGDDTGPLSGQCVDDPDPLIDGPGADAGAGPTWDYGDGHHGALNLAVNGARLNGYGELRDHAVAGATVIRAQMQDNPTIGDWGGDFIAGDRILIWQTTGTIAAVASGTTSPAPLPSDVGRWFETRITTVEADRLTLAGPLPVAFTPDAQVILLPELTDVTVGNGLVVVPQPWNGNHGGLVGFYADRLTLTGSGRVDAGERGFRGGNPENLGSFDNCGELDGRAASGGGARKGESVVPGRYNGGENSSGRGNLLHGGGGGACHNAGGGGGGHGGAGGLGGRDEVGRAVGGLPGAALTYSPATHFTMGGGGGGGERDNQGTSGGGAGGGVVFITARTITCTGAGSFDADGGPGDSTGLDGSGGGGAGGLVWVRAETITGCAFGADGGDGGDNMGLHGPGGGGGGGRVLVFRQGDADDRLARSAGAGPGGTGGNNGAAAGQVGALCGNGVPELGETCDDGNDTVGDGCAYCVE